MPLHNAEDREYWAGIERILVPGKLLHAMRRLVAVQWEHLPEEQRTTENVRAALRKHMETALKGLPSEDGHEELQ